MFVVATLILRFLSLALGYDIALQAGSLPDERGLPASLQSILRESEALWRPQGKVSLSLLYSPFSRYPQILCNF